MEGKNWEEEEKRTSASEDELYTEDTEGDSGLEDSSGEEEVLAGCSLAVENGDGDNTEFVLEDVSVDNILTEKRRRKSTAGDAETEKKN
ncbi:MAG: uncharacterized protein A8A55_1801 [Amphiamblys sp. WSBS2006]|nr:MAG: uncharacterized protein A8A55_1801 [Amphiamblys sp. WSBS2006]